MLGQPSQLVLEVCRAVEVVAEMVASGRWREVEVGREVGRERGVVRPS